MEVVLMSTVIISFAEAAPANEADFDYETDGLTAVFENNSDGIGLVYTWTFGDGDYQL